MRSNGKRESTTSMTSISDDHKWIHRHVLSCGSRGDITVKSTEDILRRLEPRLQHFGIKHITMQFETENNPHDSAILCDMEHGHEH